MEDFVIYPFQINLFFHFYLQISIETIETSFKRREKRNYEHHGIQGVVGRVGVKEIGGLQLLVVYDPVTGEFMFGESFPREMPNEEQWRSCRFYEYFEDMPATPFECRKCDVPVRATVILDSSFLPENYQQEEDDEGYFSGIGYVPLNGGPMSEKVAMRNVKWTMDDLFARWKAQFGIIGNATRSSSEGTMSKKLFDVAISCLLHLEKVEMEIKVQEEEELGEEEEEELIVETEEIGVLHGACFVNKNDAKCEEIIVETSPAES